MKRRELLVSTAALALGACRSPFLFNPCLSGIPRHLLENDLVVAALEGLDGTQYWDGHVHLIGTGDSGSGIWVNPRMQRLYHPKDYLQFRFYLNAACADRESVDQSFLQRLLALQRELPAGSRLMLLAFDYSFDEKGGLRKEHSAFHTPNDYAARIAAMHPGRLEWIASVHPYRRDAAEAVYRAAERGARAVKWLPPAMGMDPSSRLCRPFYQAMIENDLPLLVHAGEEKAVHGANRQDYGNPLLLRYPLGLGVRVIVAHCASLGRSADLDKPKSAGLVDNIDLFARLMDRQEYRGLLFGEISALTQANRMGKALDTILARQDWHARLVNASDYPLPAIIPLFSLKKMSRENYITGPQAEILGEIRKYNAILFDLLLKRMLRTAGKRLQDVVFASRRVFDSTRAQD